MRHIALLPLLCFAQSHAWSCRANLFTHDIYGWNRDGLRLDSANWNIQSKGGDHNSYSYDASGRIALNVRRTASVLDTIRFAQASADSFTWAGDSSTNWIRYTAAGWSSVWDDGYGTLLRDSLSNSGDTLRLARISLYGGGDLDSAYLIGYDSGSVFVYRQEGSQATAFMHFSDSDGVVLCTATSGESLRLTRSVSGTTISDTLWKDSLPRQCWHWKATGPAAIRRLAAPHSLLPQRPVDVLGRGVAPRTRPAQATDLTRDRLRIGTLR